MLRRTVRFITIITLAATVTAGLLAGVVVAARSAASRLLERAAIQAGVELEYRRFGLSLLHGIVLRDVTIDAVTADFRIRAERIRISRRRVEGRNLHAVDGLPAGYHLGADRISIPFEEPVTVSRDPVPGAVQLTGLRAMLPLGGPTSVPPASPAPVAPSSASLTDDVTEAPDAGAAAFRRLGAVEAAVLEALETALPFLPQTVSILHGRVEVEHREAKEPEAGSDRFGVLIRDAKLRTDARTRSVHLNADGAWTARGGDGWTFEARVDPGDEQWSGSVSISDFDLASVAVLLPRGPLHNPGGLLTVTLDVERSRGSQSVRAAGSVAIVDGTFVAPMVSDSPVELSDVGYEFVLRSDMTAALPPARLARRIPGTTAPPPPGAGAPGDEELRGGIAFDSGVLRLGAVELAFSPTLRGFRDQESIPARVDLLLSLPSTPVQRIIDELPEAVLGPLAGLVVDGALSWDLDLEAPTSALSWTGWEASTRLDGFSIVEIPPVWDVRRLPGEFLHRLPGPRGVDRFVVIPAYEGGALPGESGITADDRALDALESPMPRPASRASGRSTPDPIGAAGVGVVHPVRIDPDYRYAPLSSIAPWMISAAITTEDGEFYRHDGVNWLQAKSALERNVAAGGVVVGASTIQMQLAKNLFLDHDRTIVRKLQEVGFVALMQLGAGLSRERVMELYLNVVEFGPGIHGIDRAARYYFGRDPQSLSIAEAVWLATALPSPSRHHSQFKSRSIPPAWLAHMRGIMDLMLERGRITPEQHARGVLEVPRFRP